MRLSLPFVLGADELVDDNPIQRIAVPAKDVEGVLSGCTRDRIKGWLFQPNDGSRSVLIVPPKTKSDHIPATYTHVLSSTVADATAADVDLSAGSWTRHPQLADGRARDHAQEHQAILDSWRGGFSYVEEDEAANIVGLRGKLGAHQYDQSRDRDDLAGKDELTGPRGGEYRRMIEGSAAGRAWTPDEVGAVATLLMGPDGGFSSGIDFLMDGGVIAAYWEADLAEVGIPVTAFCRLPERRSGRKVLK